MHHRDRNATENYNLASSFDGAQRLSDIIERMAEENASVALHTSRSSREGRNRQRTLGVASDNVQIAAGCGCGTVREGHTEQHLCEVQKRMGDKEFSTVPQGKN